MPRARPHPSNRLLNAEQCREALLGICEETWAKVRRHPIIEAGRHAIGSKVGWESQAIADYIAQLPREPLTRPPAAGIGKAPAPAGSAT